MIKGKIKFKIKVTYNEKILEYDGTYSDRLPLKLTRDLIIHEIHNDNLKDGHYGHGIYEKDRYDVIAKLGETLTERQIINVVKAIRGLSQQQLFE